MKTLEPLTVRLTLKDFHFERKKQVSKRFVVEARSGNQKQRFGNQEKRSEKEKQKQRFGV